MKTHASTQVPFVAIPALLAALLLAGCSSSRPVTNSPLWRIEPVLRVGQEASRTDLAESYYRLGRYYAGQMRMREAEAAYRRAASTDPLHAEAHNALGVLLAGDGRLSEAVQSLEQALALAPERSHIASNLGYASLLAGRKADAERHLTRALQLDPANQRALSNLQQARQIDAPPAAVPLQLAIAPASLEQAPLRSAQEEPQAAVPVVTPLPQQHRTETAGAEHSAQAAGGGPAKLVAANSVQPREQIQSLPAALRMTAKPESQSLNFRRLRFEIANAMGERGAARKINRMLMQSGLPSAYLTDLPPFDQAQTAVSYASARYAAEARELARRLGAQAQEEKRLWREHAVGLRIVLGKDIQAVLASLPDEGSAPQLADRLPVRQIASAGH